MTFTLWRGHKFLTRTVDTNQYIWTEGHIGSRFITVPEYWVVSLRRPVWIQSFRLLLHCFPVQVALSDVIRLWDWKEREIMRGELLDRWRGREKCFFFFYLFKHTPLICEQIQSEKNPRQVSLVPIHPASVHWDGYLPSYSHIYETKSAVSLSVLLLNADNPSGNKKTLR